MEQDPNSLYISTYYYYWSRSDEICNYSKSIRSPVYQRCIQGGNISPVGSMGRMVETGSKKVKKRDPQNHPDKTWTYGEERARKRDYWRGGTFKGHYRQVSHTCSGSGKKYVLYYEGPRHFLPSRIEAIDQELRRARDYIMGGGEPFSSRSICSSILDRRA
jgi:hypothetical protein